MQVQLDSVPETDIAAIRDAAHLVSDVRVSVRRSAPRAQGAGDAPQRVRRGRRDVVHDVESVQTVLLIINTVRAFVELWKVLRPIVKRLVKGEPPPADEPARAQVWLRERGMLKDGGKEGRPANAIDPD